MSFDLNALLNQMSRDKGVDKLKLVDIIESAMLSAAKKHFGHHLILESNFDEETNMLEVLQFKTVVDTVEDPAVEISLEEAKRDYDSEAMVGDELGTRLDTEVLGRIAAQTAKQVLVQKTRGAEKEVIYEEYKGSKGDLVNGIVQQYDRGDLIVNLGRTEAIMPRREQIPREKYRQGDRVRALILDVDPTRRGPQIVLTRSHPDFLIKLFREEVPEIGEGTIEIHGAARDPGVRAKMAVKSNDINLDPVGACVGIKGSRVHAIVQELRGEKIDIIPYTPDAPSLVARAMSPAEVTRVLVDEQSHKMTVIVPDDQLSFAIGRGGQNVKSASKLTGWQIDVRSVTAAAEESKKYRESLESIPNIGFTDVELLFQAGFRGAQDVADAVPEDLLEIDGFDEEKAEKIIQDAQDATNLMEAAPEEKPESDLSSLMLAPELVEKLIGLGISNVQQLSEKTLGLSELEEISEEENSTVSSAIESFFQTAKREILS